LFTSSLPRDGGEPGRLEIQQIGVGLAAHGVHQASGVNVLSAFEAGGYAAALVHLNR
jgi:hypothetical protein